MRDAWKYQRPSPQNPLPAAIAEAEDAAVDEETVNWQVFEAERDEEEQSS